MWFLEVFSFIVCILFVLPKKYKFLSYFIHFVLLYVPLLFNVLIKVWFTLTMKSFCFVPYLTFLYFVYVLNITFWFDIGSSRDLLLCMYI